MKIELMWKKFNRMDEVIRGSEFGKACGVVYLLADSEGKPLYIGSSKCNPFYERYQGHDGIIDAALDGSDKHIFIAKINPESSEEVEKFLINKEWLSGKRLFNKKKFQNLNPKEIADLEIRHSGDKPNFSYERS